MKKVITIKFYENMELLKKLIEILGVGKFVELRYNATSVLSNYLRYYVDQLKSLITTYETRPTKQIKRMS
jgi:hypothetical protein